MLPQHTIAQPDAATEAVVMAFIEMIQEHKARGYYQLEATWQVVARWIANRSGFAVEPRHIGVMAAAMQEAGIITVGGGGIGSANTYDTCEKGMGPKAFWTQVDAFLIVWQHPSRKGMALKTGDGGDGIPSSG